jgi:hypothetical protein
MQVRSEADMRKVIPFTPTEVAESNAATTPADEARWKDANIVELRKEIARTKDPAVLRVLREEYSKIQGTTAEGVDAAPLMDFKVYGKGAEVKPADVTPSKGPLMDFKVFGRTPAAEPAPDVTASPAQDQPGAPQFVGTPAGAATGIEPPRLQPVAPGREEQTVGPTEQRLGIETAATLGMGLLGGLTLGPPGAAGGAAAGGMFGSLVAEFFDPSAKPIQEAVQLGGTNLAFGTLTTGGRAGITAMLGKPTERGQALLDILEARGLVPTAGAVLEGSLAKNMEAIGSADAFFGQKLKRVIADQGNVVTDDVRNFISGYQRYYGAAKEGFKVWDAGVKTYLKPGEEDIVALDRGVIDKLRAAEKVWANTGSAVDFPLRTMLDNLAKFEAEKGTVTAFKVNLEQAEAVRQLLHEQANALSGTGRAESTAAVGKDVVQAVRRAAMKVGEDIEFAIDLAVKDGRIPVQARQILLASRDLWKQWRVGEELQDALGAQLKQASRTAQPITSQEIYGALRQIEEDEAKLKRNLIGAPERARLEAVGKALQANEEAQHASQFTMAVRSGQLFTLSGAGFAAGAGNPIMATAGAALVLVPAAMGFIVRNPTASALLIRGLRLPAGSAAAARAARDLTAVLAKEGFIAPVERNPGAADQQAPGQQ